MGRHLDRQDSDIQFQRHHLPSCMWSMFHILDHHYWGSVKRMSPRRRHRRGKHTICCGYPKTISFQNYTDEVQNYLDADAVPLLDEQQTIKAAPTERTSTKARIKELMAEEVSARSQLQRASSINELGCSDNLGGIASGWPNPIIILERSADTTASRLQVSSLPKGSEALSSEMGDRLISKSLNHNFSDGEQLSNRQFMECGDVLEIFKINKKLFVEILHDPNVQSAKNFHIQLTPDKKLKKSGSFPLAVSPSKFLRPVTLEHKWKETWSFPKGENFSKGVEELASVSDNSTGIKVNNSETVSVAYESDFPSALLHGSNKHGWHHSFMRHLKDAMKKMKHTRKGRKKENSHILMGTLLHRVSTRYNDEKETPEMLKEVEIRQAGCPEGNSSDNDLSKNQLSHIRRVSSLNESMDRYARLLDDRLTREVRWKYYQSKSLRLTNEEKFSATGSSLKSFRRRLSLPDLDSFCSLPNETAYDSDLHSKNRSYNELNSVRHEQLDAAEKIDLQENIAEGSKYREHTAYSGDLTVEIEKEIAETGELQEDKVGPENQGDGACQDQEISTILNSSIEQENHSPVSVFETNFQHDIAGQTEFQVSKGAEHEKAENEQMNVDNNFFEFELNKLDDADFNYVRDVLELSGLIEQGYLGTWHSIDQPLSPTLFKELEAYLHQELECSSEDFGCNCDHKLLFDSINEVLLQIYESSLAYFPRPFSSTRRIRPLPKGNHILEDVWRRISMFKNPEFKMAQSLDDIVARDLAEGDSWMNLQLDVEDIALDLEDLIFDEFLEEVMCL